MRTCHSAPSATTSPISHFSAWQSSRRELAPGRLSPLAALRCWLRGRSSRPRWKTQRPPRASSEPRGCQTVVSLPERRPLRVSPLAGPVSGPCLSAAPAVSTLSDVAQESASSGTLSSGDEESAVLRAARPLPAWGVAPVGCRALTGELGSSCFSDHSILEAEWQSEPFDASAGTTLKARAVSSPLLFHG